MTAIRKKQNRGVETRAKILEVTKQLLSDHDYYSVTLDQISQDADVAKSSLLWHFDSKELLFSEAACELFSELEQAVVLVKEKDQSLEERMAILLDKAGDYFQNNPEPKGVLISLIFNSQIPVQIKNRIEEYWEHHTKALVNFFSYPEKPFPQAAARTILSIVHGTYLHWYLDKDKESYKQKLANNLQYINLDIE